jgi:hypothetical protein
MSSSCRRRFARAHAIRQAATFTRLGVAIERPMLAFLAIDLHSSVAASTGRRFDAHRRGRRSRLCLPVQPTFSWCTETEEPSWRGIRARLRLNGFDFGSAVRPMGSRF